MKKIKNQWYQKVADSVLARHHALDDKWAYEHGVVMKGLDLVRGITGDQKYFDFIKRTMDAFVQEDGSIKSYQVEEYNLDHINNGRSLFMLYRETGEEKYKKAMDLLKSQLETHPRTKEGGFWHKKIYNDQMWLDGIFMSSPFYAEYGKVFNRPEYFDDVALQVMLCYKNTLDEKTGLLYHAWDEKHEEFWCNKETGCSEHFWGRAMGWYIYAVVDILDYLPEDHKNRGDLLQILNKTMEALLRVQDKATGCWYQVLDQGTRPGNYLEASCSCMFLYAMAKGNVKGYFTRDLSENVRDTYAGILNQFIEVRNDGLVNINKNCQVAGLGNKDKRDGSYAYYISEPIIVNDGKGVGAFINASAIVETNYV